MATNPWATQPEATSEGKWFCTTRWGVVLAAREGHSPESRQALETLCRTYWYPLYAFVRQDGFDPECSQDLVQGFFARLIEKNFLESVHWRKGKFRSFLLVCLRHYLSDRLDHERALKRGGGRHMRSLEQMDAESLYQEIQHTTAAQELLYDRSWATVVMRRALDQLAAEWKIQGKTPYFDTLADYLAQEPRAGDYVELARQLNVTPNVVRVTVHRLRRRYGELIRGEVAQTVSDPKDVEAELHHLYAVLTAR